MKQIQKVSLGVIFYKNTKYIPEFLKSLFNQEFNQDSNIEIEYIFRDQDPEKEAYFYIQKNFPEYFKKIKFFTNDWWFHSEWHNFLIKKSQWDLYFCLSNDMVYSKNIISRFVDYFEKNDEKIATCKIKRWDFEQFEKNQKANPEKYSENLEKSKSNFLDSIWISIHENHSFFDLWQWEEDKWQYDKLETIFWPSWAFFVCDKKFFWEDWKFFDEKNLPHYKNDCDFCYSLNWKWIETKILTDISVYHDRQLSWKKLNFFWKISEFKNRNKFFLWSSLKWHLNLLRKNFTFKFWPKIILKTFFSEFKKFLFFLIFKPQLLKIYFEFFKNFLNINPVKKNKKNIEKIWKKFQ
jgi:hypothetical protein